MVYGKLCGSWCLRSNGWFYFWGTIYWNFSWGSPIYSFIHLLILKFITLFILCRRGARAWTCTSWRCAWLSCCPVRRPATMPPRAFRLDLPFKPEMEVTEIIMAKIYRFCQLSCPVLWIRIRSDPELFCQFGSGLIVPDPDLTFLTRKYV
jgi:hypothetical protein